MQAIVQTSAEEVLEALGSGLGECVYQRALAVHLQNLGYSVSSEVVQPVEYRGVIVGYIRADLIINKYFCIELKAKAGISAQDMIQGGTYVKHIPGVTECMLLNFGKAVSSEMVESASLEKE